MLESSGELFQHLQVSQVTSDLGGTIRFNHQEWIDTQRVYTTVKPPIRGQPPYNGQTACPIPLTVHTFRRDNLRTMDKILVPNVSIIQRFHCMSHIKFTCISILCVL